MRCPTCGAPTLVGALLCICGAPLAANPVPGSLSSVAASPAAMAAPIPIAAARPSPGRAFKVVGGGAELALPGADFDELLLGRHDLEATPPVVVDLDLGPIAPRKSGGFAISRRQARLARRAGRLFLAALGGAQTLCRQPRARFVPIPSGQDGELFAGDRPAS